MTFTDAIIKKVEEDLELSDEELQQMVNIDLENMLTIYNSKKIPPIITLLHLKALVDLSIEEFAKSFGKIVVDPDKALDEIKDIYEMTDEDCKVLEDKWSKEMKEKFGE